MKIIGAWKNMWKGLILWGIWGIVKGKNGGNALD